MEYCDGEQKTGPFQKKIGFTVVVWEKGKIKFDNNRNIIG